MARTKLDPEQRANATYETAPEKPTKLTLELTRGLHSRTTTSFFSRPGIGKTSQTRYDIPRIVPNARAVLFDGPTVSVDNLVLDAVRRDPEAEHGMRLDAAITDALTKKRLPDGSIQPYVVILDDTAQAPDKTSHNMYMQMQHNMTLQQYDLRDYGCVGVVVLNNDSLTDTSYVVTDLAALDRVSSIKIDAKDTNWRWALAEKYKDTDLSEVFSYWSAMPAEMRDGLSPRVMDHVIWALLHGYPGKWGLPFAENNDDYRTIGTSDGDKFNDRTTEVISKIAAMIGAPNPERVENPLDRAVRDSIEHDLTILVESGPGIGKTGLTLDVIGDVLGGDPMSRYFSMPTTDPERFFMPVPADGVIKNLLTEPFRTNERVAIVLDESNRASKAMQAQLMALNCDHEVGGTKFTGGVINLQNPSYVMGRKMTVTRRNRAQSERFTLNIKLNAADIQSNDWLLQVFPEKWADDVAEWEKLTQATETSSRAAVVADARRVVEIILDWYNEDIDDEGRQWISPRGKERLARRILAGGHPDEAIIHPTPGEKAPVVTAGLIQRLADRRLTSLQEILANKQVWIDKINAGKEASSVHGTAEIDLVQQVLDQAALTLLEENFDDIVDILYALPTIHRQAHLASAPEKSAFWVKALLELLQRYGPAEDKA